MSDNVPHHVQVQVPGPSRRDEEDPAILVCGITQYDPDKMCIICNKPGSKKCKLSSSENGMNKIEEVCPLFELNLF